MLLKTKKILVGVTAGVVATGTVLAIALPLTLGKKGGKKQLSPAEAVKKWGDLFKGDLEVKTDKTIVGLPKVGEEMTFEQLEKILKIEIHAPEASDKVTVTIKVTAVDDTKISIEVVVVSTEDEKIKEGPIETEITGFVSQEDIDVNAQATVAVVRTAAVEALKSLFGITDLSTKTAAEAKAKFEEASNNIITIQLSGNRELDITLTDITSVSGEIVFNYKAVKDDSATSPKINHLLTKDHIFSNPVDIDGFKMTDQEKKNAAQDILDKASKTIAVPNVESENPPEMDQTNTPTSIISALETELGQEIEKLKGTRTIAYVKKDEDNGTTTYKVSYTFGSETASADFTFTGFKKAASVDKDNFDADVTAFKNAVPVSITVVGKPDMSTVQDNKNSLKAAGAQIPDAIHGVARSYAISKNTATGEIEVTVTFTLKEHTAEYKFKMTGFKTTGDADQAAIDDDFAQFPGRAAQVPAKDDQINTFTKGSTITLDQINALSSAPIPSPRDGVTRTYTVTSENDATELIIEITISKGSGTPRDVKYTIIGLKSQADADTAALDKALLDALIVQYSPDDSKEASNANVDVTPFVVPVGSTRFTITMVIGIIDNDKGTIAYTYTATAPGLNTQYAGSGVLSGFKSTKTDEQKKDAIQAELDKILAPVPSAMPNKAPADFNETDAGNLLGGKVKVTFGIAANYSIAVTGDGQVTVTTTYDAGGGFVATKDIIVNGLKSDADIEKDQNQKDVQDILASFNPTGQATVDNDGGLVEVPNGTVLTAPLAAGLGITTFPSDLKGTSITYSHPSISDDGNLVVTITVKKGLNLLLFSKTMQINVAVTGIQDAIDKDNVNAVTEKYVEDEIKKTHPVSDTKLADSTKPTIANDPNGVKIELTTWSADQSTGEINWTAEITKGSASKTLTGKLTGYAKLLSPFTKNDITGIIADEDGVTLSGGTTSNSNVTLSLGSVSAPGAKTVEVTLTAKTGYLFAGNLNTQVVVGVVVDQSKFDLKKAKTDAIAALQTKYNDLKSTLSTLAGEASIKTPLLKTDWDNAFTKAEGLISNANSVQNVESTKTSQLGEIQTAFDQYELAIENANKAEALKVALLAMIKGDAAAAIDEVTAETEFTEAIMTKFGYTGAYPTATAAGATKLKYTVVAIAEGASGVAKIFIQFGNSSEATSSKSIEFDLNIDVASALSNLSATDLY